MPEHIFDTHAHYDDGCFADNLAEVLATQRQNSVEAVINCGYNVPSSKAGVALAKRYGFLSAAVGVFPLEAAMVPPGWLGDIRALAGMPKVVAIGEIGLDYHAGTDTRALQVDVFTRQLELAAELSLPVQVHTRDADADTITLLEQHRPKGVIHRFASPPEAGKAYLALGLSLAIGPNITYPEFPHVRDTVRAMPLERLVLETDAPFLPPAGMEDVPATSDMLVHVAKTIAALRGGGMTPQAVLDITCENAKRLFWRGAGQ